jgi:hypothetical protein
MSRLTAENQASLSHRAGEAGLESSSYAQTMPSPRSSPSWLGVGLVAAGVLGALAWYYLGPDLRRYLKIRNM